MHDAAGATLLRVFLDEDDRLEGKPLYAAIVEALRSHGFAGATVLKGIAGFGPSGRLKSARTIDFASNLPVLIEVFDVEPKVSAFLPVLRAMMAGGLITLESVGIVRRCEKER